MTLPDIAGKKVIITGASRGIGAAAARAFADAGAKVALWGRSSTSLGEIAGEIGESAVAVACDVAKFQEVEAAVAKSAEVMGGVDIMINNAGLIGPVGPLAETDVAEWAQTIEVNTLGVLHGMRAVLPGMLAQGHGTIINVSSGAAYRPVEGWSAYCTSKAGALMLTQAGDHENRDKGIRVLGLSPGTVATDMQREIKASGVGPVAKLEWSDHIPPEWPAQALIWMCGAEADDYLGRDVSLREDEVRRKVGLQ